jgi:hypothetical protein
MLRIPAGPRRGRQCIARGDVGLKRRGFGGVLKLLFRETRNEIWRGAISRVELR